MAVAYIIIAGTGEYSDRYTWPVRVYLNKETAVSDMARLEALCEKYTALYEQEREEPQRAREWDRVEEVYKRLNQAAATEYYELGYEVVDLRTYWELAEAELRQ